MTWPTLPRKKISSTLNQDGRIQESCAITKRDRIAEQQETIGGFSARVDPACQTHPPGRVPHVRNSVHGPKKTGAALQRSCCAGKRRVAESAIFLRRVKALEKPISAHVRFGERGAPVQPIELCWDTDLEDSVLGALSNHPIAAVHIHAIM